MKTKVYFRVDALNDKGTGHLVRSIALAKMLEKDFRCIFISKIDYPSITEMIELSGFEYISLYSGMSREFEISWIKNSFFTGNEIVVLDGYHFDSDYQLEIKNEVGKLVCIDDIQDTHFFADAIINHSGGIKTDDYSCSDDSNLFLGLDYLLLRPEFLNHTKASCEKIEIKDIMLCLGGEDPDNETINVLSKCESIQRIETCTVVIGGGYKHKEELEVFVENSHLDIEILCQISAEEMVATMKKCDTAICSPSTVALEYLAIGGNLFLHQIANNQKHVKKFLLEEKLAFPFNKMELVNRSELKNTLQRQKSFVDGKSNLRLLKIFKNLEMEMNLNIRETNFNDIYQYFEWANEEETRLQSFNAKPIEFSDHYSWFWSKLASDTCGLFVLEFNGISVGQIRFEIKNNLATISYSVDSNFRGKGFGKMLIKEGIKKFLAINKGIKIVEGYVKGNNQPSIRTFEKLGFQQTNENNQQLRFQQSY